MTSKCLKCDADCDGSVPLYRQLRPGWRFFGRKLLIGELCRSCALAIAGSAIEELEREEASMDAIR
jgi:hypothetical protein